MEGRGNCNTEKEGFGEVQCQFLLKLESPKFEMSGHRPLHSKRHFYWAPSKHQNEKHPLFLCFG